MNKVKVSVVIPSVPGRRFLAGTLESICSQTLKEIEVIVVTDARVKDPEKERMIRKTADPRIRSLLNRRNPGANGARNTGILNSRKSYIAMIDDDDLMKRDKLKKQADFLDGNPGIGAVSTQCDVIDEEGIVVRSIADRLDPEGIFFNLIFNNSIVHSSVMFRKSVLEENGLYNEELNQAQDYDLWSRMIRNTKFGQINEKLTLWREHDQSITGKTWAFQRLTAIHLAAENIGFFSGIRISKPEMAVIQDRSERNAAELRGSLMLFRSVMQKVLKSEYLQNRGIRYDPARMKTAMKKKAEMTLYSYFVRRHPVHAFPDFLLLPGYAKKIVIGKLGRRMIKRNEKQ